MAVILCSATGNCLAQTLPTTAAAAAPEVNAGGVALTLLMLLGMPLSIYYVRRYRLLKGLGRALPPEDWLASLVLGVAVIIGFLTQSLVLSVAEALEHFSRESPDYMLKLLLHQPMSLGACVAVILLVLRLAHPQRASVLQLHVRQPLRDLGAAIVAYCLVVPWVLLAITIVSIIIQWQHLTPEDATHVIFQLWRKEQGGLTPTKIVFFVVAVVFAPLTEEMLFRGLLQRFLLNLLRYPAVAIVITSLGFAAMHGPCQGPPVFVLSLALGWVYLRTGSLLAAIFLHMLFNLLQFAAFLYLVPQ